MNPSVESTTDHVASGLPSAGGDRAVTLAWLQQNLLEPLHGVIPLIQHLILEIKENTGVDGAATAAPPCQSDGSTNRRPDGYLADLRKMLEHSDKFLDFVHSALKTALFQDGDFAQVLRSVQHDIRKKLNVVSGHCQILIRRERTEFFGQFLDDLDGVLRLCRECERRLLHCPQPIFTDQLPPAPVTARPLPKWLCTEPGDLLIVDDDANSRDVLRRLLGHRHHKLQEAADGVQALEMISQHAFDVVLLDIQMPRMNGFQFLEALNVADAVNTSVIVISGLDDIESVVRCLELGATDYLSKPIDNLLLHARVNSCLQRRRYQLRQLEQFFPPAIAQQFMNTPELLNKGQKLDVSVLFCDIRGFSGISEKLGPARTVRWVSQVMEKLSESVLKHQGVLVDFIGDELVAMWGAPNPQPDHAVLACRAALDILTNLPELSAVWQPKIHAETQVGIGINSGTARVGNIGTAKKFKYGPLGNTVNLASRVQGATKFLKSSLLITEATRRLLDDSFHVRRLAKIRAINIKKPINLYEIAPADRLDWTHAKEAYETSLDLYEARQLREAAENLSNLVSRYGARGPELALLSRTVESLVQPDKWKRVWDLPGK